MIAPIRPRAFIYARFSPRSRSAECLSCDVQISDLKARAEQLGYDWAEDRIFRDDALSGASLTKRLGFAQLVADVRRGDIVMIRDYKRLARKTLDAFQIVTRLNLKGIRLYSLEDGEYDPNDTGKLIAFGVKAILAEVERIESSRRTKAKMLQHQADGRRMSLATPFGWRHDDDSERNAQGVPKRMIVDEVEHATIGEIVKLYGDGMGLRAICRTLNDAGTLRRGKPWIHQTMKRVLERAGVAIRDGAAVTSTET